MNPTISPTGHNPLPYDNHNISAWLWPLFAVVCFVLGTLLWWPIGALGIIVLVVRGRQMQAYVLGAMLDVASWAPVVSRHHMQNLFGFPFLGIAIFAGIIFYFYKNAVRKSI